MIVGIRLKTARHSIGYDGASYIAYYPYRKNITLDVSKDTDEAIASLTRNEKLQPSNCLLYTSDAADD